MAKSKLTPAEVRTYKNILDLPRDNVSVGNFTLGFNSESETWFLEQAPDERPTQGFYIPRHVFEKFIRWYQTGSMRKAR
jgi:hypothetical protein